MLSRVWIMCFCILLGAQMLVGEEFSLKDGTKILGKLVRVQNDVFEVETQYGKIKVNRSDLMSIAFTENKPEPGKSGAVASLAPVEQSLQGTLYTNQTGKFRLTVPTGWKIQENLRHETESEAGLSSADEMVALIVSRELYAGSTQSYRELLTNARSQNRGYRKLEEKAIKVDNKQGYSILDEWRPENSPHIYQYLVTIIPRETEMVVVTIFAPQPVFREMREKLEEIPASFESLPE